MKKLLLHPLFRTTLVVLAWSFCFWQMALDFSHSRFLDFRLSLLIFMASGISFLALAADYGAYKWSRRIYSWLSSIVAVICICGLIDFKQYLKNRDSAPVLIHASTSLLSKNFFSIEFRTDGTYKAARGSFLGDTYYRRGAYTMKDSIIQLDESNLFGLMESGKLKMVSVDKESKDAKGPCYRCCLLLPVQCLIRL